MSEQYELMIYFAVATLHFYRSDIVAAQVLQTPDEFRERNTAVVQRVFDEALSLFRYELSWEQMDRAIIAYLMSGQSVTNTETAVRP